MEWSEWSERSGVECLCAHLFTIRAVTMVSSVALHAAQMMEKCKHAVSRPQLIKAGGLRKFGPVGCFVVVVVVIYAHA